MSSAAEQQLLYSLRSPTLPLADKLVLASSSLSTSTSTSTAPSALAQLVRDWLLDTLFKLIKSNSAATESALIDEQLWTLLAERTELTRTTSTSTATLPIFVTFIQKYSKAEYEGSRNVQVLRCATRVWAKLSTTAIAKSTIDAVLDGYVQLAKASLEVLGGGEMESVKLVWEEFAGIWVRSMRVVVAEAAKGGKKVPAHTLSVLPTLLPLFDQLALGSPLRSALLDLTQVSLFNLDNLRRGLARDSYTSGSAAAPSTSSSSSPSTVDSELLSALAALPSSLHSSLYSILPALTHVYLSALSMHSANLFPLPAKATFPTPSAQKSALEVLGLGKRRELTGRWVRGVVDLINWSNSAEVDSLETVRATSLAQVLQEVEKGDLYRSGQAVESWEGVLPTIARGAADRLENVKLFDSEGARDASLEVLSSVQRLEYEVLEQELPRVLAVLSRIPFAHSTSPSNATSTFLSLLLTHHSRSLTMPTLLSLVSDALASSPSTSPNNRLTSPSFTSELGRAINAMLSSTSSIRSTWDSLLLPIATALQPSTASATVDEADATESSHAKKRKLSSTPSSASEDLSVVLAAAARTRILTEFIANLPIPSLSSLVEPFESFVQEFVDSELEEYVKLVASSTSDSANVLTDEQDGTPSKKAKKSKRKSNAGLLPTSNSSSSIHPRVALGSELLEARCAIVKRLKSVGLLPSGEAEGKDWSILPSAQREALKQVVVRGTREPVVVAARTLLQQIELSTSDDRQTSSILAVILSRLSTSSSAADWSGSLRGLTDEQVPVAMWEMISRRWMDVFESLASDEQLAELVRIISSSLVNETRIGKDTTTARLMKRADFWELTRVQAQFRPILLSLVSLPSLTSPTELLPLLAPGSSTKSLTSLQSISPQTLLSTAHIFPRLASYVPLEYLGRELRSQLAARALSIDFWISTGSVELAEEAKQGIQRELRAFVAYTGASIEQASTVSSHLVRNTLPEAKPATLALYCSLIQSTLSTFSDSKTPTELISFIDAAGEKPLADLAKRTKKNPNFSEGMTCEDSAFVSLMEMIVSNLGDPTTLPSDLADKIRSSLKAASKPFGKTLSYVESSLATTDVSQLRDLLEATRAMWMAKDWLAGKNSNAGEQDVAFATFLEKALSNVLTQLPKSRPSHSIMSTCLALVDLLSYRIQSLRASQPAEKLDTKPFETLIACHLVFRQSFSSLPSNLFDANLAKSTTQASLAEYSVALSDISSSLATAASTVFAGRSLAPLDATLNIAMILLRDGPDGSAKSSSAAFSELLRHLTLFVETIAERDDQTEMSAKAYLLVANFLNGVCGDRPMLLSRLNVSSVLALVSRILSPTNTFATTSDSTSAETASTLYRTLASTVGHVVRHRKDHVVPLFPQLVAALSAFLSILRRAGFGSTGSGVSLDEVDTGVVLGQRAEREAKATFPAWAWQGGSKAINRPEAAAVGRLLGSLTTKTTAIHQGKSKHSTISIGDDGTTTTGANGTTTTSLAAPLSKHAPFLLLSYLRACVHPTCPIPSTLRGELQGGWFEVMDSMGKWEREALMKGFLSEDEEAERGILRGLWKSWEKERYRG